MGGKAESTVWFHAAKLPAVLAARGYPHAWGVGRHILGSQIFDYWRDPFGHKKIGRAHV